MTERNLLVITMREDLDGDPHIDYVRPYVDNLSVVDSAESLRHENPAHFAYRLGQSATGVEVDCDGLDLEAVQAVWYRKPAVITPRDMPIADTELAAYAASAFQKTADMLYDLLPDRSWMSPIWAIKRASNKALQLDVAAKLGMNVPETLITNDPKQAREFVATHDNAIVKTTSNYMPTVVDKTATHMFYTSTVTVDEKFEGLELAPVILQPNIPKKLDLRVTVVGGQVFPAAITSLGKDADKPDWRIADHQGESSIEAYPDFPNELAEKCRAMVLGFGLKFGALDFIVDTAGKYWFLEINPNGQWAFVETATGLKIGQAVAQELFKN